ncbi:MAG TPA: hypothetical protein VF615_22565 [Longimicrobiaceae bacterium]
MSGGAGLLLRLDARRLRGELRRPRPGPLVGVLLPLLLLAAGLLVAGPRLRPRVDDAEGAVLLGLWVGGAVGFVAHPLLLRPSDDGFLRRLGVPARALYAHRAARVLAAALGIVLLLLLPFAGSGGGVARPLAVGLAAGAAAWGASLFFLARAALAIAGGGKPGLSAMMMGPDLGLVKAAPLVYAPLYPLVAGAAGAGYGGAAPGVDLLRALTVAVVAAGLAALGARRFERALPRFAPAANEMAFEPPPARGTGGLVIGGGLARLLPRRVATAWARDAVVLGRRFRWAGRIAWPVAVGGAVALLRWGDVEGVRSWVAAAGALALAAQGAALVGLGRHERGPRWIDRGLGLGWATRLGGRWAAGAGMALWLVLPLALCWGARGSGTPGWEWLLAALATSGAAAAVSVAAAGR